MTCGECGNVTAPGAGFPNHVFCKRFLLHMEKREDASKCWDFIPKPITNADRIRSMTDEELAIYLDNMQGLAYINGFDSEPIRLYPNNYGAWLEWLRQEVADGEQS